MTWKGITGLSVGMAIAGMALGLLIGIRGCSDGSPTKLLQENAELKAQVTRHRRYAELAEERRAEQERLRITAERAAAAIGGKAAAADDKIKKLRRRVVQAGREADERDDLIAEIDRDRRAKAERINWLEAALTASKAETGFAVEAEQSVNHALVASETRADKLERHVMKDRQKKILIGVGSALGGAGLALASVYAAGQVQ